MFEYMNEKTIAKYVGEETNVVIPEGIKYIGQFAFRESNIESIVFPETFIGMGRMAFSGCENLREIQLPQSTLYIGSRAFEHSGVKEAHIPSTVKSLDNYLTRRIGPSGMFEGCSSLKSLFIEGKYDDAIEIANIHKEELQEYRECCQIPDNIYPRGKFLGDINLKGALEGTSIDAIYALDVPIDYFTREWKKYAIVGFIRSFVNGQKLNQEVAETYFNAIKKQRDLTVYLNDAYVTRYLINEKLIKKNKIDDYLAVAEINNNLEVIAMLLEYKNEVAGPLDMTSDLELKPVRQKKKKEKNEKEIKDYEIIFSDPEYIKKMFPVKDGGYKCPNAITRYKGKEETVLFPAKVDDTVIDGLGDCGGKTPKNYEIIKKVVLPDGCKYIGKRAFKDCVSLETVIIPEGVREIGDEAFSGCRSLKRVILPKSLMILGKWAFRDCGLKEIYVQNTKTWYEGKNWLRGCAGYTIYAPEGSPLLEKKQGALLTELPVEG